MFALLTACMVQLKWRSCCWQACWRLTNHFNRLSICIGTCVCMHSCCLRSPTLRSCPLYPLTMLPPCSRWLTRLSCRLPSSQTHWQRCRCCHKLSATCRALCSKCTRCVSAFATSSSKQGKHGCFALLPAFVHPTNAFATLSLTVCSLRAHCVSVVVYHCGAVG